MKKKVIIGLFIAFLGMAVFVTVFLLNKEEKIETVSFGEVFKVSKGKSVSVMNTLMVKLQSVSDSRCPADVNCIWAGEISYSLTINGDVIELSTVHNKVVDYNEYSIRLDDNNESTKYVMMKIDKKEEEIK